MKAAFAAGTLDLPAKFEAARAKFETVISKANTRPIVHDASKEVRVKLKKQVLISPEFLALWDKIKGRTAYRVQIDEKLLKERCIMQLQLMENVPKARIVTRTANINVENAGVSGFETSVRATDLADEGHKLPEFLCVVDNECFLSQRTVVDILVKSGRHGDFLNNP
jgi:type III restriction enzyme